MCISTSSLNEKYFGVCEEKDVHTRRWCIVVAVMMVFLYFNNDQSPETLYIYIKYVCIFIIILLPGESTFTFINTVVSVVAVVVKKNPPDWVGQICIFPFK